MKIIDTRTITTIGTGREDFSQSTELSTIPMIRSWQERFTFHFSYVVPSYSVVAYWSTQFPSAGNLFDVSFSSDITQLATLDIYEYYEGNYTRKGYLSCYKEARMVIPKGVLFRKGSYFYLELTNYSTTQDATFTVSNQGLFDTY